MKIKVKTTDGIIEIKFKVDKNMKSYADDPFFVKKADESQRVLEKHGFPKEFMNRSKKKR